jgi:hypothetical protein
VFEHFFKVFLKWPGPLAVMIVTMIGVAGKWTPPHETTTNQEEEDEEEEEEEGGENTVVHTPLAFFTKYCGYSLVPVISRRYLGGGGRV